MAVGLAGASNRMDKTNKISSCSQDEVKFQNGLFKIEECGNTTFLTSTHYGKNPLRVLPNREYVDLRTGEVFQMKEASKVRGDNMRTLKNSLARLSKVIDFNIPKFEATLNFTLTYAENMTDTKRLCSDWSNFWKRLVRAFGSSACSEYIVAFEPQGRGAWHAHAIVFQKNKTFIHWSRLKEIWGFGMVDVDKRNDDLDSVGKYLVSYLTDMKLEDLQGLAKDGALTEDMKARLLAGCPTIQKKEHAIIKGIRMLLYPARFRFFRWSSGIEQPNEKKEFVMKENLASFGSCVSKKAFQVELEDGKVLNVQRFIFKKKVNKNFKALEV